MKDAPPAGAGLSSATVAIVGLGNPGEEYSRTRHNAGQWVLMQLANELGLSAPSEWKSKARCRYAKVRRGDAELSLVIPQSYMNISGGPVGEFCSYFKIPPSNLIVLHDELDLETGVLRLKWGGSAAGHRGVEDIAEKIGTKDFFRARIGIGRPRGTESGVVADVKLAERVKDWVLQEPRGAERKALEEAVQTASAAVLCLIEQGFEVAQRTFHKR